MIRENTQILTRNDLLSAPAILGLEIGEYTLYGSTPLGVYNLIQSNDIDILVNQAWWTKILKKYSTVAEYISLNLIKFKLDGVNYEVTHNWLDWGPKISELIISTSRRVESLFDIPDIIVAPLDAVMSYKQELGRPKDDGHIQLISNIRSNIH